MENRAQILKPGDFSLGQVHEFLGAFGRQGGNPDLLQKGIEDQELLNRVLRFWESGGYVPTTSQKLAREIMGNNSHGIEEVQERYRVIFSKKDLAVLAEIPWSENVLRECKNTHILVPGYPLTVLDVRGKAPQGTFVSYGDAWYNSEKFANKEKVNLRWHLLLKKAVQNSQSRSFDEQKSLLGENEEVPRACEVTYGAVLHYLVTGEKILSDIWVRCSDLGAGCHRVVVRFHPDGWHVYDDWDDDRYSYIGLASSRKFQS